MVEQEVKNIKILEKKEEEKTIKVSLSKVIVGFFKDTLSFNTLDQEELTINLNFIFKTPIAFQNN